MSEREAEIKKCEEAINEAKKLLDDILKEDNISVEIKEAFSNYISAAEKYLESLKKLL